MNIYHDKNIDVLYNQLVKTHCMKLTAELLQQRKEAMDNEYHVNTLNNMKIEQQQKMRFESLDYGYTNEYDVLKEIVKGIDEKINIRLEKGDFS